jgi:hypothetical protein
LIEKVNPQGQEATATLVSRFSGTYVFAEGKGGTGNANEDLWLELTDRTADKKTNNIISAVRLETSETVNGASTYVVSIHAFIDGKDLPTLILKGDLLKENGTNKSDAQVKVLSQQPSVLADSILSAQLVKNDGHGDLMFRLIIKNDRNNTPDKILLTVARR